MLRSVILLVLFSVVASAQTVTPESGRVSDGVYRSTYFGFSYTYPHDWVVHGDATNQRLRELGKQRATSTKALSEPQAEVSLKHSYQLLTLFERALGTPGVVYNRSMQIIAEDVRPLPGITSGREYLLNAMEMLKKMGLQPLQDDPVGVVISGHQFFRLDFKNPVKDILIQQAMITTVSKGFAVSFGFSVGPDQDLEEVVRTLDSVKFNVARPQPAKRRSR
jgi:hypothetical protein